MENVLENKSNDQLALDEDHSAEVYIHSFPSVTDLSKFRFWHVEPLINQAADLLDRCLRLRSEYWVLKEKEVMLKTNLGDELAQLKTQQKKISNSLNNMVNTHTIEAEALHKANESEHLIRTEIKGWKEDDPGWRGSDHQATIELLRNAQSIASNNLSLTLKKKDLDFRSANLKLDNDSLLMRIEFIKKRLLLMKKDGHALHYKQQADNLMKRLLADLNDAYARMKVAYDGLIYIYKFDKNGGATPPNADTAALTSLDDCTIWVRDAIQWLTSFAQLDQSWTLNVSIRDLVKEEPWQLAIAQAQETGSLKLRARIQESLVNSHLYVRLRGVSGFVDTDIDKDACWSLTLTPPRRGKIFYKRIDSTDMPDDSEIVQNNVPTCRIGRINSRSSSRPPEIAGTISMLNASPIGMDGDDGEWAVQLVPPPLSKKAFAKLNDLQVEMLLVGRPA